MMIVMSVMKVTASGHSYRDHDGRAWFLPLELVEKSRAKTCGGSFPEHLRLQKSILLSTIILYTTIMSTVTSDTPVAKVPQTSGMRKNGKSLSASRYRPCISDLRHFSRHRNMNISCTDCLTILRQAMARD
jgi:hypothetical protein